MISKHSMDNSNITNSYFKIDGENYLINFEKSQWFISKLGNTLATEIFLTSPDIKGDKQKKLLSEYQDDGQIKISLEAFGIFANGVPFGQFDYKGDKDEVNYLYFRKEGLEYTLDFFGSVSYDNGWVYINGELKPPYDKNPVFIIMILPICWTTFY